MYIESTNIYKCDEKIYTSIYFSCTETKSIIYVFYSLLDYSLHIYIPTISYTYTYIEHMNIYIYVVHIMSTSTILIHLYILYSITDKDSDAYFFCFTQ